MVFHFFTSGETSAAILERFFGICSSPFGFCMWNFGSIFPCRRRSRSESFTKELLLGSTAFRWNQRLRTVHGVGRIGEGVACLRGYIYCFWVRDFANLLWGFGASFLVLEDCREQEFQLV